MVLDKGLEPGETVVTEGQLRLVPGSRVVLRDASGRGGGRGRERRRRRRLAGRGRPRAKRRTRRPGTRAGRRQDPGRKVWLEGTRP